MLVHSPLLRPHELVDAVPAHTLSRGRHDTAGSIAHSCPVQRSRLVSIEPLLQRVRGRQAQAEQQTHLFFLLASCFALRFSLRKEHLEAKGKIEKKGGGGGMTKQIFERNGEK